MTRDDSIGDRSGAILNEAWRLISGSPFTVAGYLAVMVGFAMVADMRPQDRAFELGLSLVDFGALFVLTMQLIQNGIEGGRRGRRGIFAYLGLTLLSGLGIVIGFVLLVLPGLILLARWSAAYGYLLGDGEGVTSALEESWDATTGHTVPVMLAFLASILLTISGITAAYFLSDEFDMITPVGSLLSNALMYGGSALSTAIGLAVFSLLARQDVAVAEVFE
tara:strand:+ start:201 stop:863 length:663 start_codon:yes stop_codon:yes gene_type:complete